MFLVDEIDPKFHDNCFVCHDGIDPPVTLISGFNELLYGGDATDQYVPENNLFNNCFNCHGPADQTVSDQMHPKVTDHSGPCYPLNIET